MQKFVSRGLWGVLFVGGLSVLGATAANAAETTGENGTAAGTQAIITAELPVTIAGNGISVLGIAEAAGAASAPAPSAAVTPPASTSGEDAILGGTQALLDVAVPVTLTDNAVSVLGESSTAATPAAPAPAASAPAPSSSAPTTGGADGVASGTQIVPVVTAPVSVGGNAISVLGSSSVESAGATTASEPGGAGDAPSTDGSDGIASGTQVAPVVTAPITVGGNAIGVLSDGVTTSSAGTQAGPADGSPASGGVTDGGDSTLGGTHVAPAVFVPVTAAGNSVNVADALLPGLSPGTENGTVPGTEPEPGDPGTENTDGALPSTDAGEVADGAAPGTDEAGVGNSGATASVSTAAGAAGVAAAATSAGSPGASASALAETGTSPAGAGMFGLLLLAAGIGLVALKRMRARVA